MDHTEPVHLTNKDCETQLEASGYRRGIEAAKKKLTEEGYGPRIMEHLDDLLNPQPVAMGDVDCAIPVSISLQDSFCELLDILGFNTYAELKASSALGNSWRKEEKSFGYENDTFKIRSFYWGDDESISCLPNFEHLPSGFKLWWYKYPLRAATSNKPLTRAMIQDWMLKNDTR